MLHLMMPALEWQTVRSGEHTESDQIST